MDRQRQALPHQGHSTQFGLKHLLPECFVSVKLETYEEGSCSEVQEYTISQSSSLSGSQSQTNFSASQSASNQESSPSESSLTGRGSSSKQPYVLPPGTPSASSIIVHQSQMAAPIMQQTQSGNQSQSAQQQQAPSHANEVPHNSQSDSSINRPSPQPAGPASLSSSHAFGHPHSRSSEVAWLSHAYIDHGTQPFHGHQMPYLPNDAALLASVPQQQIQSQDGSRIVKQSVVSRGVSTAVNCGSETVSPTVAAVSAGDGGFISYVLNPQRGLSTTGICLLDSSRELTAQSSQQIPSNNRDGNTNNESLNQRDRSAKDPSLESKSVSSSPKSIDGHLVSRSSQTVVTMSQIQDVPLLSDARIIITTDSNPDVEVEAEDCKDTVIIESHCDDSEGATSMESECDSQNVKLATSVSSNCSDFDRQADYSHQQTPHHCPDDINSATAMDLQPVRNHTSDDQGDVTQHDNETSVSHSSNFQYLENYRPFRCDICGKSYPSQQALINHDRYHRGERPYECETCHKAFATNSHLVTHRRTHTGERPFQCQLCQRRFADRSAFVKHERTHGPNGAVIKRYKCDECGSGFVDSCGLKKHIRIHTGERPYLCNVCEKTFSTSSTFVAHKRIHTGERPYKCESCDKMFITKSHLLTHRRTHTGEKPFTCPVCNRCFADGSSFRRHERLHTGENRHICMQCGRGFPSESSLDKHKQTHVQTGTFSYVYENRSDLNCLNPQQPQNCDVQANRPSRLPVSQVRDTSDRSICFDLSREINGEVHVNRNNVCAVASREICDNQSAHTTIMVSAREVA